MPSIELEEKCRLRIDNDGRVVCKYEVSTGKTMVRPPRDEPAGFEQRPSATSLQPAKTRISPLLARNASSKNKIMLEVRTFYSILCLPLRFRQMNARKTPRQASGLDLIGCKYGFSESLSVAPCMQGPMRCQPHLYTFACILTHFTTRIQHHAFSIVNTLKQIQMHSKSNTRAPIHQPFHVPPACKVVQVSA